MYIPDRWVAVSVRTPTETMRKILGGWRGGYLKGDHWRLSSPIVEVIDHDSHYEVRNESGSVYMCYKQMEGFTALMESVFNTHNDYASSQDSSIVRTTLDIPVLTDKVL